MARVRRTPLPSHVSPKENIISKNKKRKMLRGNNAQKSSAPQEGVGFKVGKQKGFGDKVKPKQKKVEESDNEDDGFVDSEVSEQEEPLISKSAKPSKKGSKKNIVKEASPDSDDEEGEDSEEVEGEDSEEVEGEDSEEVEGEERDEEEDDDSEEDRDIQEGDFFNWSASEEESDDGDEDDSEGGDDEEEEGSEDEDAGNVVDDSDEAEPEVKLSSKKSLIAKAKKQQAQKIEVPEKSKKADKLNVSSEEAAPQKKKKKEKSVLKGHKMDVSSGSIDSGEKTEFVGLIPQIPKSITEEQIKELLGKQVSADEIVRVEINSKRKKNRGFARAFIYMVDKESLEKVQSFEYDLDGQSYSVQELKSPNAQNTQKPPSAFMPKLPLSVTDEDIIKALEKDVGKGKVDRVKAKRLSDKKKERHLLVYFKDEEALKKAVNRIHYTVNGIEVLIREAFESGGKVELPRAVYSKIPEDSSEEDIVKAVESVIGKGSVKNFQFSFRNKAFAFVTFHNDEQQQKALNPESVVTVGSRKLKVAPFLRRKPSKRGPTKKRKADEKSEEVAIDGPAKKKKNNNNKNGNKPEEKGKINKSESPAVNKKKQNGQSKEATPIAGKKRSSIASSIEAGVQKKGTPAKQKKLTPKKGKST